MRAGSTPGSITYYYCVSCDNSAKICREIDHQAMDDVAKRAK